VQVFGVPDAKYGEELCAWVGARDLMPNTTCWRRCEKCWPEPQAAH
jgi:acyl-CoA synthetase (AMP-forming)/AMP-acid ligase II